MGKKKKEDEGKKRSREKMGIEKNATFDFFSREKRLQTCFFELKIIQGPSL